MAPLAIRAENAPIGGAVAQLGERLVRNEEVRGSNPLSSTNPPTLDLPCPIAPRSSRTATPKLWPGPGRFCISGRSAARFRSAERGELIDEARRHIERELDLREAPLLRNIPGAVNYEE